MNIVKSFKKFFLKIYGAYQVIKDSPQYSSFQDFEKYCTNLGREYRSNGIKKTSSLDLGCGPTIRNLFSADDIYGVDIIKSTNENCKTADLSIDAIPFESNCFDFISAHDFIEHVPRVIILNSNKDSGQTCAQYETKFPFVLLMNEIHRVLKKDGLFISITPAYPFSIAFTDPTHVNIINEHTFKNYFSGSVTAKMYGFNGNFELIKQGWRGRYLISVLRKL